jgi:hypothetical protein
LRFRSFAAHLVASSHCLARSPRRSIVPCQTGRPKGETTDRSAAINVPRDRGKNIRRYRPIG